MRRFLQFFKRKKDASTSEDLPEGITFSPRHLSYDEIDEQWKLVRTQLHKFSGAGSGARAKRLYLEPLRLAAAITGFTLLAFVGYWAYQSLVFTEHNTAYGQITQITLPDQSVVMLNSHSSLRYKKEWTTGKLREVWLEGEAYFHVQKQADKAKFLVHSGKIQVEVLGTAFNVQARRGKTQVVLHSGKVRLLEESNQTSARQILMQPNDKVDFSEKEGKFKKKVVNVQQYAAWQQRKMVFNDTPLHEVALMLEDYYGLQVKIDNAALADRKLTGEISTQNEDVCLAAIASLLDAEVERNGKLVTLK